MTHGFTVKTLLLKPLSLKVHTFPSGSCWSSTEDVGELDELASGWLRNSHLHVVRLAAHCFGGQGASFQ